jgi:hypothetical protein
MTKGLFSQTVIAIVWDFDNTLTPQYMQEPLFRRYGIDPDAFWAEANALPAYYAQAGIEVRSDTCYLGHLLSYVRHGRMPDLTNAKLRALGAEIRFFEGIPEVFDRLDAVVTAPALHLGDVRLEVEHYVVSTGLKEMILGSSIADRLAGVWASEFIETPAAPGYDPATTPASGPISHIATFLDNTTKTRALFEINKGVNKSDITVNDDVAEDDRRVPFRNMIYVADGPSDVPSFSVMNRNGGFTLAVYDPGNDQQFRQVRDLRRRGRVQEMAPADYRPGTHASKVLEDQVATIARGIIEERERSFRSRVGPGPRHTDAPPTA